MNQLNSVLVEGNLIKDPEFAYTVNGRAACRFVLACNRFFKQESEYKKEVSFIEIQTWARQAEACRDYLTKGRGVRVVGRIKQDRWQDTNGNSRSRIYIVAEHVEFKPDFRKKSENTGLSEDQSAPLSNGNQNQAEPAREEPMAV